MGVGVLIGGILNYFEHFRKNSPPLLVVHRRLMQPPIGYGRLLDANNGHPLPPEARLRGACIGGVLVAIGQWGFGATTSPHVHWYAQRLSLTSVLSCALMPRASIERSTVGSLRVCSEFPLDVE
jgi:hypothetical protein